MQNLPVVFCIDRAGLVGADGPTHHGLMDIGYLRIMPNMVLVAPANETEMKLALEFALRQERPVCLRYPKDFVPSSEFVPAACAEPFELGKSVVVKDSPKSTIALVAYGCVLADALQAAQMLAKEGIEVDVISARFAAPVDERIVELLNHGKRIISIEDHSTACGFGSALLESAAAAMPGVQNPITVLGVPKRFVKQASRKAQLMEVGINADKIVEAVKKKSVRLRRQGIEL